MCTTLDRGSSSSKNGNTGFCQIFLNFFSTSTTEQTSHPGISFSLFGVFLVQGTPSSNPAATSSEDVFTSVEQLKGLSRLESFLSHLLDEYVNGKNPVPQVVKDFSSEMKKIQKAKELVGIDAFIGHPANVFLLVRRFIKHWTELSNFLNRGSQNDLQKILKENKPSFPSSHDLLGCATALLRIQDIYRLPAKQMAEGHFIKNDQQGPQLGADECFELGYVTHRSKYFDLARDWLKETLLRMSPEYGYKGVLKRIRVLEYLAWAEYQTGDLPEAIKHTQAILDKKPKNKKAMEALKSYERQLKYRQTYSNNLDERLQANNRQNQKDEDLVAYERLCRGEIIQGQPEEELSCFYKTDNPKLVLKPAKIELVSVKPEIQILHEAITEKEIQEMKKLAKPKLIRDQVMNSSSGENLYMDYRISRSAWLEDRDAKSVVTLNKRLQAITGLSLDENHSELLQVVNYGLGGHYEPHHDYLKVAKHPSFNEEQRDRMATILLYMSDVSAGGATVFIEPEVIVYPRKGSAVFWYNLLKSGQLDKSTTHGECPVIIGSKWVANKWVLEKGQDVTRPCGLEQDQ